MKVIVCGKRGLGDYVQGISYVLNHMKNVEDLHLYFYCRKDNFYDYSYIIGTLIENFDTPANQRITYELDYSWSTVNKNEADQKFRQLQYRKDWFFCGDGAHHAYYPFKQQWIDNNDGNILLVVNHYMDTHWKNKKLHRKTHSLVNKFFDPETNDILLKFHMKPKYYCLGPRFSSLQTEINLMQTCRYAIGIEGAWTHIAHCMKVPFIAVRNDDFKVESFHPEHPTLKIIPSHEMFDYLI